MLYSHSHPHGKYKESKNSITLNESIACVRRACHNRKSLSLSLACIHLWIYLCYANPFELHPWQDEHFLNHLLVFYADELLSHRISTSLQERVTENAEQTLTRILHISPQADLKEVHIEHNLDFCIAS